MIPLSAPSISANVAQANGAVPSALPMGAETVSFAAMLGATESTAETPETNAADMPAALMAALAGLPDGKSGKAGGKNLPDGEPALADGLETSEAPDEADPDQADVPIAAAIPVLPLNVPPLPGIGNPVEFRAAVPDTAPARTAAPRTVRPAASALPAAVQAAVPDIAPPPAAARPMVTPAANASSTAIQAVQQHAAAQAAAPAQVLGIELAPVVTVEFKAPVDAKVSQKPVASTAAQIVSMKAPDTGVQAPTQGGNPDQTPLVLSLSKDAGAAPGSTSFDKLRMSGDTDVSGSKPVGAKAPSPVDGTHEAPPALSAAKAATVAQAAPVAAAADGGVTRPDNIEPTPPLVAKGHLLNGDAELDHATEPARPVLHQVHASSQPAVPALLTDSAPAVSASQPAAEQPHDFATLVDRLSQAREAASPQVVRTALQHAEFGRVSLQFRHDDASLSVTLANADPAFNSAVHSAVAASLAGNGAGNGDQSRGDGQQQYQPSSQPQSAASGNSSSQGQQQSAQARSEQAERMFQRAQGSSPRAEQGKTASSGRADGNARGSGIYA